MNEKLDNNEQMARAMFGHDLYPEGFGPTCTCPSGDGSLRHPCPSHTTLADVQPGGRVRLGDQAERAQFEAWCVSQRFPLGTARMPTDSNEYRSLKTREAWRVWQAALSAQPSPGGQGDALDCIGRIEEAIEFRVPRDIYAAVHGELAELKAALAARQPVGELVDWANVANEYADAACNALDGMKCIRDGLLDVDQVIENQQANIERIQKLHHRDDFPPAQAVDLGQFRDAVAYAARSAEFATHVEIGAKLRELLALIDSQA